VFVEGNTGGIVGGTLNGTGLVEGVALVSSGSHRLFRTLLRGPRATPSFPSFPEKETKFFFTFSKGISKI